MENNRFELPTAEELRERVRKESLNRIKSEIDPNYVKEFFETYIYPNASYPDSCIKLNDPKDIEFFDRDPRLKEYLRLSGYRVEAGYCGYPLERVLFYRIFW